MRSFTASRTATLNSMSGALPSYGSNKLQLEPSEHFDAGNVLKFITAMKNVSSTLIREHRSIGLLHRKIGIKYLPPLQTDSGELAGNLYETILEI